MINGCYVISIKRKMRSKASRYARERRQHMSYTATLHIFSGHFLTAEVAGNVIPQKQYDVPYFFEKRYISTWLILRN